MEDGLIENPEFLWAESLEKALTEVRPVREPLIEGFLYRKSAQMIWAPDGAGKSFVTLQAAIQGTMDNGHVFGELNVPVGFNTFYVMAERHIDESLERMRRMVANTPFDSKKFVISTALQDVNLRNEKSFLKGLEKAKVIVGQSFKTVDLIVLDPIYAMVRGGLKDDEGASYVTEFSKLLQDYFGCSVLLVHHANRGTRDKETGSRVGEDMFGSRFLSAHCSGVYRLSLNKDKGGTVLECDKTSNENLEKKIELKYDPESHLSWFVKNGGPISKTDRIMNYMRTCKATKKQFTFEDLMAVSDGSRSFVRGLLSGLIFSDLKVVGKSKYHTKLYEYTGA